LALVELIYPPGGSSPWGSWQLSCSEGPVRRSPTSGCAELRFWVLGELSTTRNLEGERASKVRVAGNTLPAPQHADGLIWV